MQHALLFMLRLFKRMASTIFAKIIEFTGINVAFKIFNISSFIVLLLSYKIPLSSEYFKLPTL